MCKCAGIEESKDGQLRVDSGRCAETSAADALSYE